MHARTDKPKGRKLTRYLTHTLIVITAVTCFLTIGITIAHRLSLGVLKAFVIPSSTTVRAFSLSAARLDCGNDRPGEKRQISTHDEAKPGPDGPLRSHGEWSSAQHLGPSLGFSLAPKT